MLYYLVMQTHRAKKKKNLKERKEKLGSGYHESESDHVSLLGWGGCDLDGARGRGWVL